jgi:hypothetical protein
MGKLYAELDDRLIEFILDQPVHLVATAPCLSVSCAGGCSSAKPNHLARVIYVDHLRSGRR